LLKKVRATKIAWAFLLDYYPFFNQYGLRVDTQITLINLRD